MKLKSLYITALALGSLALGACDDNWERPPMDVPSFPEGLEATMTIEQLKTEYWQDASDYGTEIGLTESGDSVIIVGTVVSSDKAGNIYKKLIVQDETGALNISIDQSKLYQEFPQGSAVAINLTGLYIGKYSSTMQVGTLDGNRVNRMPLDLLTPRVHFDPLKGVMDTLTVDAAMLGTPDKESILKYRDRLVRIEKATFTDPGAQFAPGSTTSLQFTDEAGTKYELRSSSFSDFAYDPAPEGTGTIVGLLGYYRNTWQIELNGMDGLIGFDTSKATVLLAASDANGLNGWIVDNVTLAEGVTKVWSWDQYNGKYYLNAAAGQILGTTEAWAISPVIDLTGVTAATASFRHAAKFQTTIKDLCKFAVRAVGDASWTEMDITGWPELDNKWTWAPSNDFDLTPWAGKQIQVAFKYAASDAGADKWEICDLKLKGDGEIGVDLPDTPSTPDTPTTPDTPDTPDTPVGPAGPTDQGGTEGVFDWGNIGGLTPAYSEANQEADGTTGNFLIKVNDVTFTAGSAAIVNSGTGTPARLYHQPASGTYADTWTYRNYNKSTTTFSVADGYHITKIEFDPQTSTHVSNMEKCTWSSGTYADKTWTPDANVSSVTLTVTATVGFRKITIYYAK